MVNARPGRPEQVGPNRTWQWVYHPRVSQKVSLEGYRQWKRRLLTSQFIDIILQIMTANVPEIVTRTPGRSWTINTERRHLNEYPPRS